MHHLSEVGVPQEFLEHKFFACKMAEQSGKLSILQMQSYLDPHQQHIYEWNTSNDIQKSAGHESHEYVTYWNDTFLSVMYTDILRDAM
jgi:hypothetical protein